EKTCGQQDAGRHCFQSHHFLPGFTIPEVCRAASDTAPKGGRPFGQVHGAKAKRWSGMNGSVSFRPALRLSRKLEAVLADHLGYAGVVVVEPLARALHVARGNGLHDLVMVAPGGDRIAVLQVGEIGCLVESAPEDGDQLAEHPVVLAAEEKLV